MDQAVSGRNAGDRQAEVRPPPQVRHTSLLDDERQQFNALQEIEDHDVTAVTSWISQLDKREEPRIRTPGYSRSPEPIAERCIRTFDS